uniref:NADH-ubiquinone oxidoreductase chain 2 n=1 Tax=Thitarodes sejilaensis TaxID=1863030 RepID=A0A1L2EDZ5_9NEOP|nr:NADH dehydrogenase subunit 2 [Thitarodes sejilaensis]ANM47902.1 NADH dehydrogenase subunit 2 [Thitarodes sejilaensis]
MHLNLNSTKLFFMIILFFSSFISISSNSWLGSWIGLEINLLTFIPLISNNNNLLYAEASLKYFLIQALTSSNLLFLILLFSFFFNFFDIQNNLIKILMNSSLLMKMGAAPFHFWFTQILEGMTWFNSFILMTWQKITPLILLSYCYNYYFMFFTIILSSIFGAIGGLNQTSLRKLMAYSSINHLSWMITAMIISENLFIFYLMIYFFLNFIMCMMFYLTNLFFFNQLFYLNYYSMIKFFIFLNLLSLGGLPPFLGFLPKWLIINYLINYNMFMLSFILIMSTLITLYYYIRISYSTFLMNYLKLKWFKINFNNKINLLMILILLSLISLILSTILFYLN